MHLRAKPWASAWLTAHSDIVIDQKQATEQIGKWQMLFDQKNQFTLKLVLEKDNLFLVWH